jgi:hypothetical protein
VAVEQNCDDCRFNGKSQKFERRELMKKETKRIMVIATGVIILLFSLPSCQNHKSIMKKNELSPALAILDAEMITSKDEICSNVVEGQIAAWQTREVKELEQVYTNDIIHFDGGPAYVGIEDVTYMAKSMWIYFSKWEMKAGDTYISDNNCFGEWVNWSLFGFTEEDPGVEYDWLEFNEDGIYFWRLFYDQKFLQEFNHPERIDSDFLKIFTNAWSDQELATLRNIYNQEAQIEDTLFNLQINGVDEIETFAGSYFIQFPNAEWRLIDMFGEEEASSLDLEEYPFTYQGGIMEIEIPDFETGSCTILAAVLLAPDEEGKIIRQKMFYEPQSLISCGLAK